MHTSRHAHRARVLAIFILSIILYKVCCFLCRSLCRSLCCWLCRTMLSNPLHIGISLCRSLCRSLCCWLCRYPCRAAKRVAPRAAATGRQNASRREPGRPAGKTRRAANLGSGKAKRVGQAAAAAASSGGARRQAMARSYGLQAAGCCLPLGALRRLKGLRARRSGVPSSRARVQPLRARGGCWLRACARGGLVSRRPVPVCSPCVLVSAAAGGHSPAP